MCCCGETPEQLTRTDSTGILSRFARRWRWRRSPTRQQRCEIAGLLHCQSAAAAVAVVVVAATAVDFDTSQLPHRNPSQTQPSFLSHTYNRLGFDAYTYTRSNQNNPTHVWVLCNSRPHSHTRAHLNTAVVTHTVARTMERQKCSSFSRHTFWLSSDQPSPESDDDDDDDGEKKSFQILVHFQRVKNTPKRS